MVRLGAPGPDVLPMVTAEMVVAGVAVGTMETEARETGLARCG